MNARRCLSLAAAIAILSAVLLSQCISAQVTSVNMEQKAQNALTLLTALNVTAATHLTRLDRIGAGNLSQAEQACELGNSLFQEAKNRWRERNFEAVVSVAREAMEAFQKILELSESTSMGSTEPLAATEKLIAIKAELNRVFDHLEEVEKLASNAGEAGFDVAELRRLLNESRFLLQVARSHLPADPLAASELLDSARALYVELEAAQLALSSQTQAARSELYIAAAEERIKILRQNITSPASAVSPSVKSATIAALTEAQTSLSDAKDYLEEGKTDEAIAAMETSWIQEQQSIRILEEAGVPVPGQVTSSTNAATPVRPRITNPPGTSNVGLSKITNAPSSGSNSNSAGTSKPSLSNKGSPS